MSAAVVTLAYNFWMEKRRWEREDRVRYQQERYRTYVEFHKAAWALIAKLETWLIDDGPDYIQEDEKQLLATLVDLAPRIEMIGSKPVQDAAKEFMHVAHGGPGGNMDKYYDSLSEKSDAFRDVARKELGVPID